MRKLFFFLVPLLFLSLFSCDPSFGFNFKGYQHLSSDLDSAWKLVSDIPYKTDQDLFNQLDYWQSPSEFADNLSGDCECHAIALLYQLGEGELIGIHLSSGVNHAIVKYRDQYLEPQCYGYFYKPENLNIYLTLSFDEVMLYSTKLGTKSISR